MIQGRLAAKRLAGFEIEFPGVLNNSACKIFDKSIAATGLTEEQAQKEGFDTVSATVTSRSKHGMIPGMQLWWIKLVFDKKTKKLIGGQIVSHGVAIVIARNRHHSFLMCPGRNTTVGGGPTSVAVGVQHR